MTKVIKLIGFMAVLAFGVYAALYQPVSAATINVDTLDDNTNDDGNCTLREAILSAQEMPANDDCVAGSSGADNITFSANGTIVLGSSLVISSDISIDGSNDIVLDGDGSDRIFTILNGEVSIQSLTMQNGNSIEGGAIFITSTQSALMLNDVVVDSNIATSAVISNAPDDGGGIAIYNATVSIINSSITRNHADDDGGGIYNEGGHLTVVNSTISSNTGGSELFNTGGGINSRDAAKTILNFVTISNNSNGDGGGLAYPVGSSGGGYTVTNSIIYGNNNLFAGADNALDCQFSISYTVQFSDSNIWGTGCENQNSGGDDVYLEPGQAILGVLDFYNGSTTEVHPPLDNSPAISSASYGPCLSTDQTGASRGGCDIGAYERVDASELVLTKEANKDEVLPGDSLTYEIRVENPGEFTVTNIILMDVIPSEFLNPVVVTSTIVTQTSGAPNYEWELPDLGRNESVVIEIMGTVEDKIPTQIIVNTASVTGDADVYSRLEHAASVTVLNVPPNAVDDNPPAVDEGTVMVIDALDNDDDDNGDTLTITAVGSASNGDTSTDGAMVTYTPTLNFSGQDVFTYTISDGNGGFDTATITVMLNNVNDPPYFASTPITSANVGLLYSYTAVGADPDMGDTFTVTVNTLPTWLNSVDNGDGTVTISGTAALGDIGPHTVELEVEDEAGLVTAQNFTVTVTNTNSPPAFVSSPVLTATIGDLYTYMVMATDPNTGDSLTITAPTLPGWLSFADNGDGTAVISGTASIAQVGEYAVALEVTDSISQTATQMYTVTVINRAPTFDSMPVTSVVAGDVYTYNISASDLDAGDAITITEGSLPSWLSFMDNGDGTAVLSGMPTTSDIGDYAIELEVEDSFGLTDTQAFTLSVMSPNPAPSFTSTPVLTASVGNLYTYNITVMDNPGDSLTITGTYPAWLTLTDNGDGTATLSGTPTVADLGPDSVALEVTDSLGQTDTQAFMITVVESEIFLYLPVVLNR